VKNFNVLLSSAVLHKNWGVTYIKAMDSVSFRGGCSLWNNQELFHEEHFISKDGCRRIFPDIPDNLKGKSAALNATSRYSCFSCMCPRNSEFFQQSTLVSLYRGDKNYLCNV
jgi:hypothetical protein